MTTPSPYGQPEYPDGGQQPGYPSAGQQPGYPAGQPGYPSAGYAQPGYGTGVAPKSKTTAALLAFFLGHFGAHNFYRGQKGRAFGHLALTVAFIILTIIAAVAAVGSVDARGHVDDSGALGATLIGGLGYLLLFANGVWVLVEFIMILVSKDGSLQ
jgi:hypothetical membrane protein